MRLARRVLGLGGLLLCCATAPAAAEESLQRWELTITGHRTFVFGDQRLGAGVRLPWRSEIRFVLRDGEFLSGLGESVWLESVDSYSRPPGWFSCHLTAGTFLDRKINLRDTPWVRYPKFAVAGRLNDAEVELRPAMGVPGNFLAVTYRCESEQPVAENWFLFAGRARQEDGRRQDARTGMEGERGWAEIKEVRLIPPESVLRLPLRDGLLLTVGDVDSLDRTEYRLRRLP